MRIQHNIMAMSAYRNYTNNVSAMKKNLEKLSSGYKINRAGDDAAGLAISEKMRAQITGLETAQKNAKDGISLVQTAEGALTEVHDMLNRMVELATQSANGTYDNTTDRKQMQKEVDQLLDEIDRIADSSNFNGIKLLDGTLGLNTDAFKVIDSTAYQAATSAATATLKASATHGGETITASAASFSIDLKALKANIATGTTNKVTFTLSIGGQDITASVAGTAGGANAVNASTIAQAFADKYTGTTASTSLTIGGAKFKAAHTAGQTTLTFTLSENWDGTNFKGAGSAGASVADAFRDSLSSTAVNTLNSALNAAKVEVDASVTAGSATWANINNIDHGLTYTAAVAKKDGGLLGGEIELTADLLKTGAKLTIDKKEFTFKVEASATNGGEANTIAIDTNKFVGSAAQLAELKRQLTTKDTTNFDINTAAGNKISIDQKASVGGTPTNSETYKKMADVVISKTVPGQTAKNANTRLAVTDGEIKEGNVITVGTDKFVSGKDFTNAATLKSAIAAKGYTVATAAGTGDYTGATVLTISAKTADDAAPTVLGKGLTLQIGDTADEFNQLNVKVQDMHSANLGIGKLKINTEEAAQAATNKIKDAINVVSDVRGTLGATQNRLEHTINNLGVMTENIQDAESTIRDVDVAEEMMAYTKNNILIQSAQAMLAQANQVPQGVLQLLG